MLCSHKVLNPVLFCMLLYNKPYVHLCQDLFLSYTCFVCCHFTESLIKEVFMLLKRWTIYLFEMYQPITRLIFSVFSFLSILWLGAELRGSSPEFLWSSFGLGVSSMMLILLYYRICDEFKDFETDQTFFPERPLPSGRISLKDLHYLRAVTVFLVFALNLFLPLAFAPFLILYLYAFLMGKWFFIPAMANHRLWAFITHSPISFFGYLYLYCLTNANVLNQDKILLNSGSLCLILWLALPGMIWEITRKTRAPLDEEPGYQTYSEILGYRGASLLAVLLIVMHLVLTYWLWFSRDLLPFFYLALLFCLSTIAYLTIIVLFCFMAERFKKYVQPVSEIYVAVVLFLYPLQWLTSKWL